MKPNPRDMADETVLWSASKNYTNVLIGVIRNHNTTLGDNEKIIKVFCVLHRILPGKRPRKVKHPKT